MEVSTALFYVVLGALLGAVGQSARVIVGIKKQYDAAATRPAGKEWFNVSQLVISLVIGAIAGSLGAVSLLGEKVDKQFLLALIATGYAGADFIEGFMKTKLSK